MEQFYGEDEWILSTVIEKENNSPEQQSKPSKRTPQNMGEFRLKKSRYFDAVLLDGETLSCKLIEYGQYDLCVETEMGKILLPKHSVKYFILEKHEE